MRKIKIFILVFTAILTTLNSQEKPMFYVGPYAGYNYNIHFADFKKLGNINNCCPLFESGTGSGYAIGGLFEYPLRNEILLGARLGISEIGALLSKDEIIGNTNGKIFSDSLLDYATVEHTIDSKIMIIGFEPYVNYKFFGLIDSYLGFKFAYMISGKIDQQEELIKPDYVTFKDGKLTRNVYKNVDIPNKNSFLIFGFFGLGFDLNVTKNILLTPEVIYYLPLNNIYESSWKASTWQIGMALKFPIFPPKVLPLQYDTLFVRDTLIVSDYKLSEESIKLIDKSIKTKEIENEDFILNQTTISEKYEKRIPKASKLDISITAVGIRADGTKIKKPALVIEEIEVEEGFPLLPYIFFKESSSNLNETGMKFLKKDEIKSFSEESLPWNTLEIYYNLLNIIGSRLSKQPNKNIIIVGCNNNSGNEKNNLKLSEERAKAVENYLLTVWDIKPNQIKTRWQNLPDNPGNINDVDGIVENQRVELKMTDNDINKPVYLKDIEKSVNPPVIALYPEIQSDAGIKNWEINVKQNEHQLRKFDGNDLPTEIMWQLEDEPMPQVEAPVKIDFKVQDKLGQSKQANETLSLQQLTIKKKRFELKDDKKLERFFLIVFDYNSAEIKSHHIPILNDIKKRIMPDSKVTISGFTDRTGNPEYNLDLAKRRCQEVQKYLKVNEQNLIINPVGNKTLLYDNDLSEGRSYCRTVQIIIETPVLTK
jgi:outer membrane protein OmpA-like peptidoglycan-associated protein